MIGLPNEGPFDIWAAVKNFLVLSFVIIGAVLAYKYFNPPPPPPILAVATPTPTPTPAPTPKGTPAPRLMPEGTFAILDYVSARTKTGVIGFEPGQMVHFVSADPKLGTLTISDGTYQIVVRPDQLTNDLDVASIAKRRDQAGQQELQNLIASQRDEDNRVRHSAEIDAANSLGRRPSGAAIGTSSTLARGSSAASSYDAAYNESLRNRYKYGSPYYYLAR